MKRTPGDLLLLSLYLSLAWIPDALAEETLFPEVPICDSDQVADGGDDVHAANGSSNIASIGVSVEAFESLDQSAFVELRRSFSPLISMPFTVAFGPVNYFGELRGFGGTGTIEGSIRVTVTLEDQTDGVELASQVLLDEAEDGAIATQVINLIDSGFNPPSAEFNNVFLVSNHTYRLTVRVDARAKGLGAVADFVSPAMQLGCLSAISELVDSDGDGLYDDWEENGVDVDADGVIDVDLPAFGANPDHKDIFIEYDWVQGFAPARNDIQNVKLAFANAPLNAGGTPNPDGQPGINIWIDTGTATDPAASEDGAGPNTCGDGIDNNADGFADQNDPDCLSGDNLGGGNVLMSGVVPGVSDLDSSFYFAKNGVLAFTPSRRGIFRYGIQGDPADAPPGLGGRAERGGDDFVVFNRLPGSMFHEIGHTLNLSHGGDPAPGFTNCKPNYVSVMNYHHQLGLRMNGGAGGQDLDGDGTPDGRFLDFSPARFPGGRAQAPLDPLDETSLNDGLVMDATDPVGQFAWVEPTNGMLVRWPVDTPVNWNPLDLSFLDMGQQIDIDRDGPSDCTTNIGLNNNLTGYDDWSNIRMTLLADGDLDDAAVNPVLATEPDEATLFALEAEFNTTDVAIEKADAQDPVEVGDPVDYTLTATNAGPNPASKVVVRDTLPDNVSLVSMSPGCSESPAGEVSCELGELLFGEQAVVQIRVDTDAVCVGGLPPNLENTASVANEPQYPGPDLQPGNNSATETTVIVDTTPPEVFCNAPATITPPDAPVSFTATAVDLCDPAPVVEITDYFCSKLTRKGKVIDKARSCVVSLAGDSVVIEDSGGVDDLIEWTAQATDSSGNVGTAACSLAVANPAQ